ncbi:FkbM family methyltransferase [Burkholderia anthina]|uniref:FkbM family methyltransferase n=1 Tax=Burkholderia anthina TaxID=179879 RepID=UPI00158BE46F|nr:FkbM family methyltransferase [Burkholderia anthina]
MEALIRNFVTIESVYGPFIINRHCHLQADALIKTGRPHIQTELDAMMHIVDQLPEHCVVVDGGANAGLVCVPVAQRVHARGGYVHAFEPQRTLYYALGGTVALGQIDNIRLYNMGLGATNTTMTVPPIDYGQRADFGTVTLEPQQRHGGTRTHVARLDALGLERLDFLKLDVEGMEIDVLRGARTLLEQHQPWCWIEYWKVGVPAIMAEFAGLDYVFYRIDGLNLLCVPQARWDRARLWISGEPVDAAAEAAPLQADGPAPAPQEYWNRALAHEARCEWGQAAENWCRAYGNGLDDTVIAMQVAWCMCFAGQVDAGLRFLEQSVDAGTLSGSERGRVEHVRSWLLMRGERHAAAAEACMTAERIMATPLIGLPPDREYVGQPLAGKRLLVASCGGAGDQIQHGRYLHALQHAGCASVTVIAHPGLVALLRHNFPGVDVIAAHDAWIDVSDLSFDYWCTFVTLAAQSGFAPRTAHMLSPAYLACPDDARLRWATWLARRSPQGAWRIGLNWHGREESDARFHRASSARDFEPFTQLADAACFSLNRDLVGDDEGCTRMTFPGAAIRDFTDLAALILGMDVIVTTCTAQVHLAGALGVPAILLLSPKPDARWGAGDRTALYPGVQVVRAPRAGCWSDAIEQALVLIRAARIAGRAVDRGEQGADIVVCD